MGWSEIYQEVLWVIPAYLDDGKTGVPPHVLYRSGSWCLKKSVGNYIFGQKGTVPTFGYSEGNSPYFPD